MAGDHVSADDGVTRHVEQGPDDRSREERKRDRQMIELLNELRVALPGVQILFAFLLTVPFSMRFSDLTLFQRAQHLDRATARRQLERERQHGRVASSCMQDRLL